MTKILLVEDDASLGATLHDRLVKEGYAVTWSNSLRDAIEQDRGSKFDLYIFDVGLPDGTGFELAKILSARPLVFLTAQGDPESRLTGYDMGAEEYIPKPFHLRELLLRIRHVLENHRPASELKVGAVVINFDSFTCERDGKVETVAAKDLALLRLLVEQSPRVISRDEALNLLWGEDKFPSNRTVDNSVLRLRTLLGGGGVCIESIRGVGYRWDQTQIRKGPK